MSENWNKGESTWLFSQTKTNSDGEPVGILEVEGQIPVLVHPVQKKQAQGGKRSVFPAQQSRVIPLEEHYPSV